MYKPPHHPESPLSSFNRMSPDRNEWTDRNVTGFYAGYVVFFLLYIYITVVVIYDIIERGRAYEDDIKNDLDIMHQIGLTSKMGELNRELEERLAGGKKDQD